MKLLIRWAISSFALFAAASLVPGIVVDDGRSWMVYAAVAVILGLVNALIRPVMTILTCPLIMLTLGVFTLVINAFTLWISANIAHNWFDVGFYVDGFWPAFWGGLIVSIVSVVLNTFVKDDREERRRKERRERRAHR